MTTTQLPQDQASAVLDAMRDMASDQDGWNLADVLVRTVPHGVQPFADLIRQAQDAGIAGKLSVDTLRLYRDTAKHWPKDMRVPGVSFSAHREAERLNDVAAAVQLLKNIAANNGGASGVTVVRVRGAVAIKQGRTPASSKRSNPGANSVGAASTAGGLSWATVLADLRKGAPALVKALADSSGDLDAIHKGLSNALGAVEDKRRKAARKATPAAAPAPAPAASVPTPVLVPADSAGDLRGL